MLFVIRQHLADRLLARLRQIERHADRQAFAELEVVAHRICHALVGLDRPLCHRRRAAADETPDAMAQHELDPARAGTDNRLPAFNRQVDRSRLQGYLLESIAAIEDISGYRVVLALVRKGFVVERLEDELDLLFEHLAVSLLVDDRRTERFHFAAVIAAADAEYSAALGQDVGARSALVS